MLRSQFVRYAIVGLISNSILYLAYLLLTAFGLGHKTSMTVLYVVGILQTFLVKRRRTFDHQGDIRAAFARCGVIYLLGYLLSFFGLYMFVDLLGFAHQLVQGVIIVVVAVFLLVLLRLWVFDKRNVHLGSVSKQEVSLKSVSFPVDTLKLLFGNIQHATRHLVAPRLANEIVRNRGHTFS